MDEISPSLRPIADKAIPSGNSPHVLLTYAQSLDSKISAAPGIQTKISSYATKVMTHYLRSHFGGILVGISTFLCDDPGLNSRYPHAKSPRPIILDPNFRSLPHLHSSKIVTLYKQGLGGRPIVIVSSNIGGPAGDIPKEVEVLTVNPDSGGVVDFGDVFSVLGSIGVNSVMVEGGAYIINKLLMRPDLVNTVLVTIGSVFLGERGVGVTPPSGVVMSDVTWWHGETDAVVVGALQEAQ